MNIVCFCKKKIPNHLELHSKELKYILNKNISDTNLYFIHNLPRKLKHHCSKYCAKLSSVSNIFSNILHLQSETLYYACIQVDIDLLRCLFYEVLVERVVLLLMWRFNMKDLDPLQFSLSCHRPAPI